MLGFMQEFLGFIGSRVFRPHRVGQADRSCMAYRGHRAYRAYRVYRGIMRLVGSCAWQKKISPRVEALLCVSLAFSLMIWK